MINIIARAIVEGFCGVRSYRDHFLSENLLDINSVIVDLGAHKGEFSKIMAENYPYSKIILIEPDSQLIQDIRSSFSNIKNIEIYNACKGAKTVNNFKFYLSKNREVSSLIKDFAEKYGLKSEISVKMITLKDIFFLFNIKKVDLLKVDIEGAEWDLFESFTKQDYERINQISVEFHDFENSSLRNKTKKSIRKLRKLGYLFIHKGTNYMNGSPYYNCLFFKLRPLIFTEHLLTWIKISFIKFMKKLFKIIKS